jgi:tetratricopeptide (TPR) repeat protein
LLEEAFRLSEEGRVLAAIQTCQQAIAINPNSTSAHSMLGTLYERQGDRDNAIRSYEHVLTLSPGSTVERRRLNELMGVPAAREAAGGISPRTARIAVTSFATVVALVLVGAIVMTLQQPPRSRPAGQSLVTAQAQIPQEATGPVQTNTYIPSPGSQYFSPTPRFNMPRVPQPRAFAGQPGRNAQRGGYQSGGAQWIAPGTYMIPATAAQRSAALRRPAQARVTPPFVGAVRVYGAATPTTSAPAWRPMPTASYGADAGRSYYFQGDYQRSIDAYQTYLSQNPTSTAREELAWVYTEAGDRSQATQQYQRALSEYQADLGRSHNVEAARHGVRTCESALKALEAK